MVLVVVSVMVGCILGVVAMSLVVMSKSSDQEEY